MNKELYDEIIILKQEDVYTIVLTDKARELIRALDKGKYFYPSGYLRNNIYFEIFMHFIKEKYQVDLITRCSAGNAHDAYEEEEVIAFNENGFWKNKVKQYKDEKGCTYSRRPVVKVEPELTDEIIDYWAETYDLSYNGERLNQRFVYCSKVYDDLSGTAYRADFGMVHEAKRRNCKEGAENNTDFLAPNVYMRIKSEGKLKKLYKVY